MLAVSDDRAERRGSPRVVARRLGRQPSGQAARAHTTFVGACSKRSSLYFAHLPYGIHAEWFESGRCLRVSVFG